MGRDQWPAASAIIKDEPSYVNVGFVTSYNESSRELTVDVELYYVEDAPFMVETNYINVALTENQVYGYQANGGTNYEHNHVLRYMITGQWGDEVTNFEQGTLVQRSYTYTVPEEWDAGNCDITCFVAEGHSEVITGGVATLIDGSFDGTTELDYGRLNMADFISTAETESTTDLTANFLVGDTVDATYSFVLTTYQPDGWSVSYTVNETNYTANSEVALTSSQSYPVVFHVTPGASNGVGHYILEVSSNRFPQAEAKQAEFYVVKGVTDLVVNGSGTFSGVNSADYEAEYLDALSVAGSETCGAVSAVAMAEGFSESILNDVENIFLNISYTHPTLSDDQIDALENYIDNGGNLLIAGQDIGWDAMASAGYGTLKMKLFYANYLQATYSNDGDSEDNKIYPVEGEKLFGNLPSGELVSLYGNTIAADNIYPAGDATGVLYYASAKGPAAAIRATRGDAKIVYLAFGLEQVVNNTLRDSLMSRTYQWFTGQIEIGVEEAIAAESGKLFPNPAGSEVCIENEELNNQTVEIVLVGIDGKVIYTETVSWNGIYKLSLDGLNPGLYFVKLNTGAGVHNLKFVKE